MRRKLSWDQMKQHKGRCSLKDSSNNKTANNSQNYLGELLIQMNMWFTEKLRQCVPVDLFKAKKSRKAWWWHLQLFSTWILSPWDLLICWLPMQWTMAAWESLFLNVNWNAGVTILWGNESTVLVWLGLPSMSTESEIRGFANSMFSSKTDLPRCNRNNQLPK